MAPHRVVHTLHGSALGSLKSLAQMPVDTAGVALTGIAAGAAWVFGSANVSLFWIVGFAMLLDLVVGALRAIDDPLQEFSVAKLYGGLIGKLFRLLLIPTFSLIDRLFMLAGIMPAGMVGDFPITKLGMFALAAAELTSVLAKFRDGGVAPQLIAEVVRHLDRLRTGQEPPTRRHYDMPAITSEIERKAPPADDPAPA